jgi:SAM-dependent methyltransferase|tara:strand:+ start:842 stop:1636 length:795 start_codon:yes stop_codon:yes gene_type:complete
MNLIRSIARDARDSVKKTRDIVRSIWMSYPKKVQCNICMWEGRHFFSDSWHDHINCPRCHSGIRQRLFFAAVQNIENLSFDRIIHNKNILHFAPEEIIISSNISNKAANYTTADFLRQDCDYKLDMSNMPKINNESFDIVIAFDVLEHVPDYQKALEEVHRVLSSKGFAIFTVPQKDNLQITYEDPSIITPEDRTKYFGQWDHLRIFGDDFTNIVESKGFDVVAVNESMFSESVVRRHVLFPPTLSKHPLATNYRKVFFCQKHS